MQKKKIVEGFLRDHEQPTILVDNCTGRAGRVVEQRHFAKHLTLAENGKGLFAHAAHTGNFAEDADFALENDVKLVARIAIMEDSRPGGVHFFGRDGRDHGKCLGRKALENWYGGELRFALDRAQ